jgi:hypothetical protein
MGNSPHDVYQPSTSGGSNVRFEDGQITPDTGLAHERTQMEVSAIAKYPRVPMLRYPFANLSAVLSEVKRATHCVIYFPGSLSSIPASNDPAAVKVWVAKEHAMTPTGPPTASLTARTTGVMFTIQLRVTCC